MSLIHTSRLNGINPFEYLLAIAKNSEAVKLAPEAWLPWNYPNPPSSPTAAESKPGGIHAFRGGDPSKPAKPAPILPGIRQARRNFGLPHAYRSITFEATKW